MEWIRNGVRVEEDSNHTTSRIIVDTSANTVYNNTLRVRGRESGTYKCTISSERHAQETSRQSFTREISVQGMVIANSFIMIIIYYIRASVDALCRDGAGRISRERVQKYLTAHARATI